MKRNKKIKAVTKARNKKKVEANFYDKPKDKNMGTLTRKEIYDL